MTATSQPALAMLEVAGIARGMVVCDAMVKRAAVEVLRSHPVDPGKYAILFCGPVADVDEAMEAAEEAARGTVIDRLMLPYAHHDVVRAVRGAHPRPTVQSLGIVETHTLAGAIEGLDKALKMAEVQVVELRLSAGLGGKGYFVVTGQLHDVEAAVEAAVAVIANDVQSEIIAQPHPDFVGGAL